MSSLALAVCALCALAGGAGAVGAPPPPSLGPPVSGTYQWGALVERAPDWVSYSPDELDPKQVPQTQAPVAVPGSIGPFVFVAAGDGHACGLLANGSAFCFGTNVDGQLGSLLGRALFGSAEPVPVYLPGGGAFTQLSSRSGTTCGVLANQSAYCWGAAFSGQFCDGTEGTTSPVPKAILPKNKLLQIVAGGEHTCMIEEATLEAFCCGSNHRGQAGNGAYVPPTRDEVIDDSARALTPVRVKGGLQWAQLTAGDEHTCGLTVEGDAYCWGSNELGQLGSNSTLLGGSTPTPVAGGLKWDRLEAGAGFTCGLERGTGRALCWGDNQYGQLGVGPTQAKVLPQTSEVQNVSLVPLEAVGGQAFASLAAGRSHACGLLASNASWICWGSNNFSQRASSDATADGSPSLLPTSGLNFTGLAAGGISTYGLLQGQDLQLPSVLAAPSPAPGPTSPSPANSPDPPPPSPPDPSSSGAPIGAIVGGVVGGLVLLAAFAVFLALRRRRRRGPPRSGTHASAGGTDSMEEKEKGTEADTFLETGGSGNATQGSSERAAAAAAYSRINIPADSAKTLEGDAYLASLSLHVKTIMTGSVAASSVARTTSPTTQLRTVVSSQSTNSRASGSSSHRWDPRLRDWVVQWEDVLPLQAVLGKGSFGKVYLAQWNHTAVAVKVLLTGETLEQGQLELPAETMNALEEESLVMARMRHPCLVAFMGVIAVPPCIVTEYCSGGSLYDLLGRACQYPDLAAMLTWRLRLSWAMEAAAGLLYLHRRTPQVIHRDIKSPNLLIDRDFHLKVADFNLARIMEGTHAQGEDGDGGATNPRWLAPEVMCGLPASAASDVFSFAVVLHELLTWRRPWQGVHPFAAAAAVRRGQRLEIPPMEELPGPPPPSEDAYRQYVALMRDCWAQQEEARPDFDAAARRLGELLSMCGDG